MRMLGDLSLYGSTFSPLLLEETAAFYKQEGQRLIETADLPHYLTHCEVRGGGSGCVCVWGGGPWGAAGEGETHLCVGKVPGCGMRDEGWLERGGPVLDVTNVASG